MDITTLYTIFTGSNGVTTDSRNCPEGSVFFALRGESFNGNMYAKQALEKGCSYAVIDDIAYMQADDNKYILVEDTLKTLQQLANYHRRKLQTKIIGITGTNGKTTTKELIAAVLQQSYNVLYTLGNLNNHIGVPLTLLRLKPEHNIAVIEMGANHRGEIKELAHITEPDCGIITNVGKAHLEGFGSFEGVIQTKGELYDFLRAKEKSVAFVNYENKYLLQMSGGLNTVCYGAASNLYVNGQIAGNNPYLKFEWKAGTSGKNHVVETQLIGDYNFTNALAAVAIGHYMGVADDLINKAIADYQPRNNRSQLQKTPSNTLIIDAYNANPTSMKAAIENFAGMDTAPKMMILGDMKELGNESAAEHQYIIDLINTLHFEQVILIGESFAATNHQFQLFDSVNDYIATIEGHKPMGMTILIKGSNSMNLNRLPAYL